MNVKYVLLGLARRYAAESLLFTIMKIRGEGSLGEHDPDGYLAEWQRWLGARGLSLVDQHILDVGSGRYARFALRMLAAGARRITLVDLYAMPLDAAEHQALLRQDCAKLGLDLADVLARINIVQGDFTLLPVPAAEDQVDLVISSTVLEHVRDPAQMLARCCAWLKPGGATCHFIDLRDHNLSFRYPFEMLTFSDQVWERWLDLQGGFHLNRWRAPDYINAMHEAGFASINYDASCIDHTGLKQILPRLDRRFQTVNRGMLAILSLYLYGEKLQPDKPVV